MARRAMFGVLQWHRGVVLLIAALLLLLITRASADDARLRAVEPIIRFAVGWVVEGAAERDEARGHVPGALLEGGYQSLCFADLAIVDGELEAIADATRRFCTAARSRETRAALRCWSMATVMVNEQRGGPSCNAVVSTIFTQRARLLRLSGSIAHVRVGERREARTFTAAAWHSAETLLRSAVAFGGAGELAAQGREALARAAPAAAAWSDAPLTASGAPAATVVPQQSCVGVHTLPLGSADLVTIGREYATIAEGLRAHASVCIVDDAASADWVLYIPSNHAVSAAAEIERSVARDAVAALDPRRVAIIDLHDTPARVSPLLPALYFKRSFVARHNGSARVGAAAASSSPLRKDAARLPRGSRFLPITFSVLDRYVTARPLLRHAERPFTVANLLRPHSAGHYDESRARVLRWTTSALLDWGLGDESMLGQVTHALRTTTCPTYFSVLRRARIVVTGNPSNWEGDHRTWEALASGALVFVDRTETPVHPPLIDGVHVVVYDAHDETAFRAQLRFYLDRPDRAEAIGKRGAEFVLRHHRAVDRAEYMLSAFAEYTLKSPVERA